MPLIKITVDAPLDRDTANILIKQLSSLVASHIGKPEQYVMAVIEEGAVSMSGTVGGAAFADVKSIGGLTHDVNRAISKDLCALLHQHLGIPPERVYLTFSDVPRTDWGWNGGTFG